jgi:hypothetical protein
MSELDEQESEFSQLLRDVPFNDAVRDEHRDALRERALAVFDSAVVSDKRPGWKRAWNQGREIMRRPIPRLIFIAAACLVVAGVWLFVPGRQTAARAFNKLAETLVGAKTARFQMQVKVENVNFDGKQLNPFGALANQKFQGYFLAPAKYRNEMLMMVNIVDWTPGHEKTLTLVPATKQAIVMNLKAASPKDRKDGVGVNYFQQLRELLANSRDAKENQYRYRRIGEKEIDRHRAVGFQLDSPTATVTLWGDPATGAPVQIDFVYSGTPRAEVVMSHFEINVDLPASLFDMVPPAGYKVRSFDMDVSLPSEQSLIGAFKGASDIGKGEFPESLDSMGVMQFLIKHLAKDLRAAGGGKGLKGMSDDKFQRLFQQTSTIAHGFRFALELPESADAHYAGKGVKRDAKDRPIFWYKPQHTSKYRVIFADLSVKDADNAPQAHGARQIERASKTAKPAAK